MTQITKPVNTNLGVVKQCRKLIVGNEKMRELA